ncbi:hypothetical protein K443DRAFT_682764 [Laccaria amethystina LaAM-08-1]|uniref:Uncharacterized protein n=1 Tax=Laccaria amethystina LaAM-08-1 TaxID=1095629 RepID=A0A0C9WUA3_9AGAR|nr:hypothetical protein K443DRAFT_682764 [Laccaria amethystina LaAM-08-1]
MSTVPDCTQNGSFSAFYNSLGQSPCYIATALANVCMGGSKSIRPLPLQLPQEEESMTNEN